MLDGVRSPEPRKLAPLAVLAGDPCGRPLSPDLRWGGDFETITQVGKLRRTLKPGPQASHPARRRPHLRGPAPSRIWCSPCLHSHPARCAFAARWRCAPPYSFAAAPTSASASRCPAPRCTYCRRAWRRPRGGCSLWRSRAARPSMTRVLHSRARGADYARELGARPERYRCHARTRAGAGSLQAAPQLSPLRSSRADRHGRDDRAGDALRRTSLHNCSRLR